METVEVNSIYLSRNVKVDFYSNIKSVDGETIDILLVNDGQDLVTMNFEAMLNADSVASRMGPLIVAGIHCSADRNHEYGMIAGPDFKGWGSKAALYERFVVDELMPLIEKKYKSLRIGEKGFAGFSLGALSAFDIAWNNPALFTRVGAFSASFWWRTVDKGDRAYDPWVHRMMHKQIAASQPRPGMKFFFECGEHDEEEDRNRNGVIDSIDDTIDIMRLLLRKGYFEGRDFYYLQMPDGRHDVASWAKAFPRFLEWGYGRQKGAA
jgi:enterochelin esterase-like enzyme